MSAPSLDAPDQAVILVGGLGTRLGALTKDVPKPLLEVAGRPFLEYVVDRCVRFGFSRLLLLAGHRGERVADYAAQLRTRLPSHVACEVLIEPAPRGTAGALQFAADRLSERFLLLNGDSLLETNWLDLMVGLHCGDPTVVMTLRRVPDTSRYGVVTIADGLVTAFADRGPGGEGLINGGVYLCHRRLLEDVPQEGSLERDVLPVLCARRRVGGRVQDGYFVDIGVPEDFARAQTELPAQQRRPAVFFDRDGTLNEDEGYTHRPEALVFKSGAVSAVKRVNDLGYYAFLVTNQAGVAKGHFRESDIHIFHVHLQRHLRAAGAHLDDIRYCPDHPDGIVTPYNRSSGWRKPAPGMLLDLMQAWPVVREKSLMIGDKRDDVAAAEAAGIRGFLYESGDLDAFVRRIVCTDGVTFPG